MGTLDGKVAVVTGGAMGIGGATARRLAAEGAKVVIADAELAAAQANAARIAQAGGTAVAVHTDVSSMDAVKELIDGAAARWGRLDILVNNAYNAKEPDGSAVSVTDSALDYGLTMMVKSLVWSTRYAVPYMQQQGGGAVVNIASVHGYLVAPRKLIYETGKAAVIALTRQMAVDFSPLGIRVNSIAPGHIVTERMQERWNQKPSILPLIEAQYPVGRAGTPDDIANAVRFLVSAEASFITGHNLVVDGGLTIQLQEDISFSQARYVVDHPELDLSIHPYELPKK